MHLTSTEYLNKVAQLTETHSDYAVAKLLGISTSRMSNYRTGRNTFDNATCLKVAQLLGIDPLQVIIDVEIERAQKQQNEALSKFWTNIKKGAAAAILSVLLISPFTGDSTGYAAAKSTNNIDYAKYRRHRSRWRGRLRAIFSRVLPFPHAQAWGLS